MMTQRTGETALPDSQPAARDAEPSRTGAAAEALSAGASVDRRPADRPDRTTFGSPSIDLGSIAAVSPPAGLALQPPAAPAPPPAAAPPSAPLPPAPQSAGPAALATLPPDLWRALARHGLLLPLLRQSVIAAAVAEVQLSEEESLKGRQAWGAANRLSSAEAVMQHLRAHALEESDALWQAELPLRIARHCQEHFCHRAEQRFLARKNQLDQVIYSLLRVEDGALARELYLRISEGEADFAELAATYSQGPERSTRGVVGPVPLLQAHPSLAELLRTSRPGQLRPPLRIEQWWLVVRLESLNAASFNDEMRDRMARELFDEWVEEEVRATLVAHDGRLASA